MPSSGRPILGVDIASDEVRVAELHGSWPDVRLERVAAAPLRPGVVEGGRVADPDLVAAALRSAIARAGITVREAVFGIADRGMIARMMEVPKVPDAELRTVVRGELEHYQILRQGMGNFDLVRVAGDGEGRQVLVMAAEDVVVTGYQQVAERAGLRLIALEPAVAGLIRLAHLQTRGEPSTICLSVSHGRSEVTFTDQGQVRLFRRIDIGTDDLVAGRLAKRETGPADLSGGATQERVLLGQHEDEEDRAEEEEEEETEDLGAASASGLNASAANSLAIELQRSMDYYGREFPQAPRLGRVMMASNDPAAEPLAEWLSEALHVDMVLVALPATGPAAAPAVGMPDGMRYTAAAGLGMHNLVGLPSALPRFDLSTVERVAPEMQFARGKMTVSLAISLLLVLAGGALALRFGMQANVVEHELEHARPELAALQKAAADKAAEVARKRSLVQALAAGSFAAPRIMDEVAGAVDPHAGLTRFDIDPTGKITLEGEAANQNAMIATLRNLQFLPGIQNAMVDSYDTNVSSASGGARVVRFALSARVAGTAPQAASAAGGGGGASQ